MEKLKLLLDYLTELNSSDDKGLCVAFSGGVDSAVVLKAARMVTERVLAVTVTTPLHPAGEPEEAAKVAKAIGCAHEIIRVDEIAPEVAENTPERCYLCKHGVFERIGALAKERGLAFVLDGTNADDMNEYRPGLRALAELGVKSPLRELGLPKSQVREIAAEMELSVAKKPSAPCLATRFPYYDALTPERLAIAGGIEAYLKERGFDIVRARLHGAIARLEVPAPRFAELCAQAGEIAAFCRGLGLDYVTLDLEGFRSGSMDLHVK